MLIGMLGLSSWYGINRLHDSFQVQQHFQTLTSTLQRDVVDRLRAYLQNGDAAILPSCHPAILPATHATLDELKPARRR